MRKGPFPKTCAAFVKLRYRYMLEASSVHTILVEKSVRCLLASYSDFLGYLFKVHMYKDNIKIHPSA
jgi:hypothetical protein